MYQEYGINCVSDHRTRPVVADAPPVECPDHHGEPPEVVTLMTPGSIRLVDQATRVPVTLTWVAGAWVAS